MKHVICCGLAVLDHVFYLPEIPKTPIKSFATNYHSVVGGNAATAAVALSRAGGQAVFWGRLGDDQNGDLILSELEAFGVDVGDVLRLPGVKSGVSSVLIDAAGERLITNYIDRQLINNADWVIDLGPGAGNAGGKIIAQGTPEDLTSITNSQTGTYLRKHLGLPHLGNAESLVKET